MSDMRYDLGLGAVCLGSWRAGVPSRGASSYCDRRGLADLRRAIAEFERTGADQITVTSGASLALSSILSLLPPGAEVLAFAPYYPAYPSLCRTFGLEFRSAPLRRDARWRPDLASLEAAIGPSTAAIIWNFPNNPTGATSDRAELRALDELARRHDLLVVADEVYRDLWFDEAPASLADSDLRARIIRIGSFSKAFQLAGERVGYVVAPPEIAAAVADAHWTLAMSVGQEAQRRALRTLSGDPHSRLAGLRSLLAERREHAVAELERFGLRPIRPDAGVFLWIDLEGRDPVLVLKELAKTGVVVMPGAPFGGRGWIRCAFAVPAAAVVPAFSAVGRVLGEIPVATPQRSRQTA